MASLSQTKLLTQILNLKSVRVTKYRNLSGIGIIRVLTKGEKRNSKRMATVAAVYTIKPWQRTAEQIINGRKSQV